MQTELLTANSASDAPAAILSRDFAADAYALIQNAPSQQRSDTQAFFAQLGELITKHAAVLAVFHYDDSQVDAPLSIITTRIDSIPDNVLSWCLSVANRCLVNDDLVTESSKEDGGTSYKLTSVKIAGATGQCLLGFYKSDESTLVVESTLQLAAPAIVHHQIWKKIGTQSDVSKQLAALTELIGRIEIAEHGEAAAVILAENLSDYLLADHAVVALADDTSRLRVVAASNRDQIVATSEETRLGLALMQEATSRGEVSVWPSGANDRHALLCHRQYAMHHHHHSVIGCPLRDNAGVLRGAVLVSFTADLPEHAQSFLQSAQRPVATTLQLLRRAEQNRLHRRVLQLFSTAKRKKLKSTLLCATLIAAVLCIPIPYTVKARCKLEPTHKRYLAAPFAGKLIKCLVEPGDVVEQNQLLAHLDGQETEWELASVNAELQRAMKERAGHVVEHESGKARIAQHEIEYLRSKANLLSNRISQLEVRSPVAGIIVSGDLTKAEGVPLEVGQSLFEIAPLDAMIAELSVPEDDVRFVDAEMPTKIHLDAFPHNPYETSVDRIRPRAEIRDSENVFVANANIEDKGKQLRPGMEGNARIKSVLRPIGWVLFHKPVAAAVSWLGL